MFVYGLSFTPQLSHGRAVNSENSIVSGRVVADCENMEGIHSAFLPWDTMREFLTSPEVRVSLHGSKQIQRTALTLNLTLMGVYWNLSVSVPSRKAYIIFLPEL